jgi:hypothetical protein
MLIRYETSKFIKSSISRRKYSQDCPKVLGPRIPGVGSLNDCFYKLRGLEIDDMTIHYQSCNDVLSVLSVLSVVGITLIARSFVT